MSPADSPTPASPAVSPKKKPRTFGKRVWAAIEETQGFGFISDDICYTPDDEAYQRTRDALGWERETVKRLAALLRSYERQRDARFAKHAAKVIADVRKKLR